MSKGVWIFLAVIMAGAAATYLWYPSDPTSLPDSLKQFHQDAVDALNDERLDDADNAVREFEAALALARFDSTSGSSARVANRLVDSLRVQVARARDESNLRAFLEQIKQLCRAGRSEGALDLIDARLSFGQLLPDVETELRNLRDWIVSGQPKADEDPIYDARSQVPDHGPIVHGLAFVKIDGGEYEVGTPLDEIGREAIETLPFSTRVETYFISTTEVTQEAFDAVLPREWAEYVGDKHPAHSVTFEEARRFCSRLTNSDSEYAYTLPNESEWEIACRARRPPTEGPVIGRVGGERGLFQRGVPEATQGLKKYAHFSANRASSGPGPVSRRMPNAIGLFDVHGNVSEWCLRDLLNPTWYTHQLTGQPLRGGSVQSKYERCRAGSRSFGSPDDRRASIGFRIIARPKQ